MVTLAPKRRTESDLPPPKPANPLLRLWRVYVVRRIVYALFVIWLVTSGTFFMVRAMPGDPIEVIAGRLSQQGLNIDAAREQARQVLPYDPDANIFAQYFQYFGNLATGDFGWTISQRDTTVLEQIMKYLPWTLFSVGLGVVVAISIGMAVGMVMAYRRGGWFDHIATPISSMVSAIPNYLGAMAIVLIGSTWLGLFDFWDMRGRLTEGVEPGFTGVFIGDALYHVILPVITYAFTLTGAWALMMKAATTEVLSEDYITIAKARGLKERRVGTRYVGRNSVLPMMPTMAFQIGTLVGGAIIVEEILSYPGVGQLLVKSIALRDYPVIQAVVLILTVAIVFSNLVVDLLNGWLDPRIRSGEATEAAK